MPAAIARTSSAPEQLWLVRSPAPTAAGIACRLGWLQAEFARDGIRLETRWDDCKPGRRNLGHGVIFEGGSLLALAARSQETPTRLVGLTWLGEGRAPLPITVHQRLLDDHFDLVARFLAQALRAADWAAANPQSAAALVDGETARLPEAAWRHLHPDLSAGRIALLERERAFAWLLGFDFDIAGWIDPRPLAAARQLRAQTLSSEPGAIA